MTAVWRIMRTYKGKPDTVLAYCDSRYNADETLYVYQQAGYNDLIIVSPKDCIDLDFWNVISGVSKEVTCPLSILYNSTIGVVGTWD